jgi:hypothetical protein
VDDPSACRRARTWRRGGAVAAEPGDERIVRGGHTPRVSFWAQMRKQRFHFFLVAWCLGALAACGGSGSSVSSSSGGSSSDAGPSSDGSSGDAGATSDCFATAAGVTSGTPCVPEGKFCEYACNDTATCTKGVWERRQTKVACPLDLPPGCPATLADITENSACATHLLTCVYPTGTCDCVNPGGTPIPDGGSNVIWVCGPGPSCPTPRPKLGSSCTTPEQQCTYAAPDCPMTPSSSQGEAQVCKDGYWQAAPAGCLI